MIVQILSIQSALTPVEGYVLSNLASATEVERVYCVPKYICLAQAILESKYGNSNIAKNANNHFGIKWYKHCGHEYYQSVPNGSKWRCYESVNQSYMDYGYFLDIHTTIPNINRKDYKIWCFWIAKTGYAGRDKKKVIRYKNSLISIIERYNLHTL